MHQTVVRGRFLHFSGITAWLNDKIHSLKISFIILPLTILLLLTRQVTHIAEGPQADDVAMEAGKACMKQVEQRGLITAVRTGGHGASHSPNTFAVTTGCKTRWLRVAQWTKFRWLTKWHLAQYQILQSHCEEAQHYYVFSTASSMMYVAVLISQFRQEQNGSSDTEEHRY